MVITRSGTFTISRVHLYVHGFILYACIYFSYAQLLGIHTILKRLTELDSAESLSHRSVHQRSILHIANVSVTLPPLKS